MNTVDVLKDILDDLQLGKDWGVSQVLIDASDEKIAALTEAIKQLEWVPVTERTPDNDGKVIVYVPDYSIKVSQGVTDNYAGYTAVGHYLDGKWHQPHIGYPGPVTMWKQWPKDPEGKGKTKTQQMLDEVIGDKTDAG
jgi:hypothetical protein